MTKNKYRIHCKITIKDGGRNCPVGKFSIYLTEDDLDLTGSLSGVGAIDVAKRYAVIGEGVVGLARVSYRGAIEKSLEDGLV